MVLSEAQSHKRCYLRLLPESEYQDGLWECASGSPLGAVGI